jgi:hypothetical protein
LKARRAFNMRTAETQADASGNPIPKPQILITSKYDPLDPFYIAATPSNTATLGPDIVLQATSPTCAAW